MRSHVADGRTENQPGGVGWWAALAGAAGSAALTLYAGLRVGAPRVLLALFAAWVVFPFVVLALADWLAGRRSSATRRVVARGTLATAVASVAIYALAAVAFPRPPTAIFVLVAPASLLLNAVIVPATVALGTTRRRGPD